jgi:hypothetical protein
MDELSVRHSRLNCPEALHLIFVLDPNEATNRLDQLLQVPIRWGNSTGAL